MSTEPTEHWEALDWSEIDRQVFHLQMRIFRFSQESRRNQMYRLQKRLTASFYARCLAVRRAAQDSRGRHTAGVDGRRSLTDNQKLALARSLHLSKRPDPVRRVSIPKPGSDETRNLGIPTIADRAHQHLISLALEPEWEARFSRSTFGFRKGRSCHDALINIRLNIQRNSKWVLDGDIEKFFDRLDHRAILKKLDTFPAMEKAIGRILHAGILEGEICIEPGEGTPQGGPLSPLLANIALTGLEDDLTQAFPPSRVIEGRRINKVPRLIVYADDFVVLHESRPVIDAAHSFISAWLQPLGLNLSPTKTNVRHTLHAVDGVRGFDFLGCHIQQHEVGPHQVSPFFNGLHTHISPSRKSMKRIYRECAEIIDQMRPNKKRNAERTHREQRGAASIQEILIHRLNCKLKGWGHYFCVHNFKREFSRVDNLLYRKLIRWLKRTHPNWRIKRLIDTCYNGGNPWIFSVRKPPPDDNVELIRVDSLPKKTHILVIGAKSYYDGDWSYWGRRRGSYPGHPPIVGRCLKRQSGRCHGCNSRIERTDRVLTIREPSANGRTITQLLHAQCAHRFPGITASDPYQARMSSGARCVETRTPGSEAPLLCEGCGAYQNPPPAVEDGSS